MSFKNVANSLVVLAAAFQGSSGAVLRGRSLEPNSQHGQPNALAFVAGPEEPSHATEDVLNRMFHGGHRVPTEVMEIVRRASSAGVAVSEEELLQLIQDVQDVEQRLSALLGNEAPAVGPNDEIPEGAAEDTETPETSPPGAAEDTETPETLPPGAALDPDSEEGTATAVPDFVVSGPVPDELMTGIVDSANPSAAAPTRSVIEGIDSGNEEVADGLETVVTSSVLAGGSGCTLTITQTFTEFIFDAPSTLETASALPSDLEDFPTIEDDAPAPSDLPDDVEDFPTVVDDTTPPQGDRLAAIGASEPSSAVILPSATALSEEPAPVVTEPPAPADVAAQDASSEPPSAEPAADSAEAAPSEPGKMTLMFPGDEASGIAWRTISLP